MLQCRGGGIEGETLPTESGNMLSRSVEVPDGFLVDKVSKLKKVREGR